MLMVWSVIRNKCLYLNSRERHSVSAEANIYSIASNSWRKFMTRKMRKMI